MRRYLWICILVAAATTAGLAEQTKPGTDIRYTVQPFHFQVDGITYAHPQKLTAIQVARILSVIHIELDFGRSTPVLDAEERMQLAPKVAELFGRMDGEHQVEIKKVVTRKTRDGKKEDVQVKKLYLCFLDPETLYVAYTAKGTPYSTTLKQGLYMERKFADADKRIANVILLKKDLWTDEIMTPVFSESEEKIEKLMSVKDRLATDAAGKTDPVSPPAGTGLTLEQLEKELARLQSMFDKKLIDENEYNRLRKAVLKKAGIGN